MGDFNREGKGTSMQASHAIAVTPSDVTVYQNALILFVGGTGTLKVQTELGDTVTLAGIPAGFILPLWVTKVFATGTTATNITGLY